jgi:hypothetical protein
MPWLYKTSVLGTIRYVHDNATLMILDTFRARFAAAQLGWLLDGGPPPPFWVGADLDNDVWRRQYMLENKRVKPTARIPGTERVMALMKAVFPHKKPDVKDRDAKSTANHSNSGRRVNIEWGIPRPALAADETLTRAANCMEPVQPPLNRGLGSARLRERGGFWCRQYWSWYAVRGRGGR